MFISYKYDRQSKVLFYFILFYFILIIILISSHRCGYGVAPPVPAMLACTFLSAVAAVAHWRWLLLGSSHDITTTIATLASCHSRKPALASLATLYKPMDRALCKMKRFHFRTIICCSLLISTFRPLQTRAKTATNFPSFWPRHKRAAKTKHRVVFFSFCLAPPSPSGKARLKGAP